MVPMSVVAWFVPGGGEPDYDRVRELVQQCLDDDSERTHPTLPFVVLAYGPCRTLSTCAEVMGPGLMGTSDGKSAERIWHTQSGLNASTRFKMLRGMRDLSVYVIINGADDRPPWDYLMEG